MQRPLLQRVPTPPLLRHQSPPPSAPPSVSAGQRAGAGGVGDGPSPLAAGARGSAAPGTAASTGHRVSGERGRRPRPCRLPCPGIHHCFSYPSVLAHCRHARGHPTTQPSSGTGPRCRSTGPEAQSPPLRPASSVWHLSQSGNVLRPIMVAAIRSLSNTVLCIPGWPYVFYVSLDDHELMIFLLFLSYLTGLQVSNS